MDDQTTDLVGEPDVYEFGPLKLEYYPKIEQVEITHVGNNHHTVFGSEWEVIEPHITFLRNLCNKDQSAGQAACEWWFSGIRLAHRAHSSQIDGRLADLEKRLSDSRHQNDRDVQQYRIFARKLGITNK
jgi:hypothetical protein